MNRQTWMTRREFAVRIGGVAAATLTRPALAGTPRRFRLRYLLGSAMYGYTPLAEILPEVKKTGATAIDIWPKVHGNQREQIERMGHRHFAGLLEQFGVKLGGIACYRLGPFGLRDEMRFAAEIGGPGVVLVCGARGPQRLRGDALKEAVGRFVGKMKPHVALAERTGCTIAIENHAHSLIESPDSIRYFADAVASDRLGIALAPHHLPQDARQIAGIVADLGPKVKFFYAQQHGMGSTKKLPKAQEMLQLPGRGPLDFTPILAALKKIDYQGYTEIFMHPVPRGVPILDSTAAITRAINESRAYLDRCLQA